MRTITGLILFFGLFTFNMKGQDIVRNNSIKHDTLVKVQADLDSIENTQHSSSLSNRHRLHPLDNTSKDVSPLSIPIETQPLSDATDKIINSELGQVANEKMDLLSQKKFTTMRRKLDDNQYVKRYPESGFYGLASIGYAMISMKQDLNKPDHYPLGLTVNSALGFASDRAAYSIEFGSYIDLSSMTNVKANRFQWTTNIRELLQKSDPKRASKLPQQPVDHFDVINWSTQFYVGIRARFPTVVPTNTYNPFFKVFIGRGISVLFLTAEDDAWEGFLDDTRFQLEGFSFGWSISNFYNVFDEKPVWFWELSFSSQLSSEYYFVAESGELPTELANESINQQTVFYALRFAIGGLFF